MNNILLALPGRFPTPRDGEGYLNLIDRIQAMLLFFIAMMKYSEQLQSPYWYARREEIKKRDNYTCRMCTNSCGKLIVHHIAYKLDRMAWEYPDCYLITLCEDCHKAVHYFISEYNDPIWTVDTTCDE